MKNVTITLDEEVVRWARIWAAQHDTSMSQMVSRLLQEQMRAQERGRQAMMDFLAASPVHLKTSGRYPRREELCER